MLRQYHIRDYDFKLIFLVSALTVIGILAIGSAATESLQTKQIAGFVLGLFLMLVISLFDYSVLLKLYWLIYLLNIALLALVKLIGVEVNGAKRWVVIMGIQFQPSETAKIMILLFFAQFIMKHKEEMHSIKTIGSCVLLFLPPVALIYKQPDMSTSIMVGLLFCVILLIGGISWKYVIGAIAVAVPAFVILLMLVLQPDQKIINGFQQERILAWIYPEEYAKTTAYQQTNSIIAIGSGMLY
ncbi:MAG: FtsW/RodA/SpoVE family cell cycle protein, partial [Lachnospiraceae bacterium]|nr:FtsW/RodA/SpoVE family cell cycle protein [Lachnospiraceae bacterium]